MQKNIFNVCFLLFVLFVFIAGCAKAPRIAEKTKPIEQQVQVTPKPIKQPAQPSSIIGKDGVEMVLIPAGEFMMGSPDGTVSYDEPPRHVVFLDAFYIDKYEVTNAQYKQFMDAPENKGYTVYQRIRLFSLLNHPVNWQQLGEI